MSLVDGVYQVSIADSHRLVIASRGIFFWQTAEKTYKKSRRTDRRGDGCDGLGLSTGGGWVWRCRRSKHLRDVCIDSLTAAASRLRDEMATACWRREIRV